jgi:hypothetical protein
VVGYLLIFVHAITDSANVSRAIDVDENFIEFTADLGLQAQHCRHVKRVHHLVRFQSQHPGTRATALLPFLRLSLSPSASPGFLSLSPRTPLYPESESAYWQCRSRLLSDRCQPLCRSAVLGVRVNEQWFRKHAELSRASEHT